MKLEYAELNELWLSSTCVFLKVQVTCVGFFLATCRLFLLFRQTGGQEMQVQCVHYDVQMNVLPLNLFRFSLGGQQQCDVLS